VPFLDKSDYLCLRYGDKTIIFKADANVAIVVAGPFFKLWHVSVFPGYTGCNQRTKSERKTVRLPIVAGQSCSEFFLKKNVETVREV